jgi:Family of unknown function (DUF6084)
VTSSLPISPLDPGQDAPRLAFAVEDGGVMDHAAVPTLRFGVRIESSEPVRSLALNVQLRIAATRRRYEDREEERLAELFGRPEQWARTLKSLHWTNVALHVPAFAESTVIDLPVTCTYDLEVTASRYMSSLDAGEIPLEFLFGGTLFYGAAGGGLQVRPVAWDQEAEFKLPVAAWREMMDRYFPGSAWLRLRRDAFERLHAYRATNSLLTWEETVDALLREAGERS